MPWFRNVLSGLEWHITNPEQIKDLKKDENYELVDKGEEEADAPVENDPPTGEDNGDDNDEPDVIKKLKNRK